MVRSPSRECVSAANTPGNTRSLRTLNAGSCAIGDINELSVRSVAIPASVHEIGNLPGVSPADTHTREDLEP